MAEATVDETSLVGIFGRECPSSARDRLTTVPTAAISAGASMQSFELEQQFALRASKASVRMKSGTRPWRFLAGMAEARARPS